jgi:hypothetical protein
MSTNWLFPTNGFKALSSAVDAAEVFLEDQYLEYIRRLLAQGE